MNALDLPGLMTVPQQFALIAFRLLGLFVAAPLFGSSNVPRMVKLYLGLVMALCLVAGDAPAVPLPGSPWRLAAGVAGELALGLFAGLLLSMAFYAARWAGGLAGQQMGFNLAGSFGPQNDMGGNPLGTAYYIFALLLFLAMDGHHQVVLGVRESFDACPPLAFAFDADALATLTDALAGAASLAIRLAAPVCVAMLVVDLSLGMLGKTIPSLNLLSVGLSVRAMVGLAVVIGGLGLTGVMLGDALIDGVDLTRRVWNGR